MRKFFLFWAVMKQEVAENVHEQLFFWPETSSQKSDFDQDFLRKSIKRRGDSKFYT